MYIGYNGDVLLCCMDWRRRVVLGNVAAAEPARDLERRRYRRFRRLHDEGRDDEIELCSECSYTLSEDAEAVIMRPLDFPNSIQLETTSRCNASCSFCPYPETSKTQPSGVMDDDLFRASSISSRRPVLLIQPFLNNDPLMDPQIVPRLDHTSTARFRGARCG